MILAGGDLVDGTGAPRRRADVAVRDDRIVAVGDLADWHAGQRVDARGQVVAPGFIDVHTHDDHALLAKPDMDMKVSQGVTSVVVGNCGFSLAPLVFRELVPGLDLLGEAAAFRFPRFDQFVDAVEAAPAAVNAAFLVGHNPCASAPSTAPTGPPTGTEIKACAIAWRKA